MYPTLLKIGPLEIHTWGLLLAIAFLVGILLSARRAEIDGIDPNSISNLGVVIMISGVLGGRILYILYHLDLYKDNPLEILAIWHGGLMIYGGVLAAFLAGTIYIRKSRLPFWRVSDILAPALALGLFIGRVGCFFNGCCFGKPSQLPWTISFPPGSEATHFYPDESLHPAQLYESFAGLLFFILLLFIDARSRKQDARRLPEGFLFLLLASLYSIWRFGVDFLRGYEKSAYLFQNPPLTINQAISLILLPLSLLMIFRLYRREKLSNR